MSIEFSNMVDLVEFRLGMGDRECGYAFGEIHEVFNLRLTNHRMATGHHLLLSSQSLLIRVIHWLPSSLHHWSLAIALFLPLHHFSFLCI